MSEFQQRLAPELGDGEPTGDNLIQLAGQTVSIPPGTIDIVAHRYEWSKLVVANLNRVLGQTVRALLASGMTRKLAVWSQPVEAIGLASRVLSLLKVASNFPLKRLDKIPSLTIGGGGTEGAELVLCRATQRRLAMLRAAPTPPDPSFRPRLTG